MSCSICGEDFCKFDFHPKHEREKAEKAWAERERRFNRYPMAIELLRGIPQPPWDEEDVAFMCRVWEFVEQEPKPEPEPQSEPKPSLEDEVYYFQRDMEEDEMGGMW